MKSNPETINRWLQRVEEFKSSGITRKAFCEKHQINVSTLDYWREKLEATKKRKTAESGWIPLKIAEDSAPGIDICIGRVHITVTSGFDRSLLIELIQTLASC